MKRSFLLLMALIVAFLSGCTSQTETVCTGENILVGNTCFDFTKPEIDGIEETTVYLNETFDALSGVVAMDDIDGDLTNQIIVEGSIETSEIGTYLLKYRVSDLSGNEALYLRYVIVTYDPDLTDYNLIGNGNFSNGATGWTSLIHNVGGDATFTVVDGVMEINVLSVSTEYYYWDPRLEYMGLPIEYGKTYYVSFDAKSEAPRTIHVQFGELLPADPWFTDSRPGVNKLYNLTTEFTTYSFTFTMNIATNYNGGIIFEMGHINDNNTLTTVYIDNVIVKEIE